MYGTEIYIRREVLPVLEDGKNVKYIANENRGIILSIISDLSLYINRGIAGRKNT